MKNINPTLTNAWKSLENHFKEIKDVHLSDLFNLDKDRFKNFSKIFNNKILFDYSKNRITYKTINKLLSLAKEVFLEDAIKSMFIGNKINVTENRSVLHIALRNLSNNPIILNDKNIMPEVYEVLNKMKLFSEDIITGKWKGYSGKSITDIVNIGIGGSDLGPNMVIDALTPYKNHLNIHFVSNVDGTEICELFKVINAETTLFLISSKTFTTEETMTNAHSIKNWFLKHAIHNKYIKKHFLAISINKIEAINFGIDSKNIFKFWDWVGGRYSLWSSVGFSIVLSIGFNNFLNLLSGAHDMDNHFLNTKLENNIPVILAMIGIWYNNFFLMETEAIFPYDKYMHRLPSYLQQCNMESNGKCIDRNGKKTSWQTGPIVWGASGTNGQHAFYQLLHQGTKFIPCDFIAPVISHHKIHDHHTKLLSNFFAQTKALAFGTYNKFIEKQKIKCNNNINSKEYIYKYFEGNRPSNSILLKRITPYTLGSLLAMYEHKIFVQGIVLNIFTFDQWGVELGKSISHQIRLKIQSCRDKKIQSYDSSTNGLINLYFNWREFF
ncbi:glucose-6-phosphate isomerase [Buchnera aphidicola (Neophyllaphis podocarpi)]|uniref:glucose-6-phosphate isomerase n=1 Tax=Buchnera aphidicola TaxID=9 RepID=UPI0031B7F785